MSTSIAVFLFGLSGIALLLIVIYASFAALLLISLRAYRRTMYERWNTNVLDPRIEHKALFLLAAQLPVLRDEIMQYLKLVRESRKSSAQLFRYAAYSFLAALLFAVAGCAVLLY